MTQDGAMIGSLNYMSPEQMLGRPVDLRSDIFSVGSLAYELIFYHQAFKGSLTDGLLNRLPNEPPQPLTQIYPGLSPAIERAVMKALEKAPDDRYQSLAEMRTALAEARGHKAPETPVEDEQTIFIPRGALLQEVSDRPPEISRPPSQIDSPLTGVMSIVRGNDIYGEPPIVTDPPGSLPLPAPTPPPEEPSAASWGTSAGRAPMTTVRPPTIGLKAPPPTPPK